MVLQVILHRLVGQIAHEETILVVHNTKAASNTAWESAPGRTQIEGRKNLKRPSQTVTVTPTPHAEIGRGKLATGPLIGSNGFWFKLLSGIRRGEPGWVCQGLVKRSVKPLDAGGRGAVKLKSPMKRLIFFCLMLAPVLRAADATNAASEVSVFTDRNLEAAVRQQVFSKRDTDKPLTAADVATVAVVQGNFRGITNLTGLEHCKSLASLELAGNRISDLKPLSGLRQLQYVHLASNRIADVTSLGTLPALQYIQLESNQVVDPAPLAACTNLASIYLSRNKLKTVAPLTQLPRVVTFYADGNGLKSVAGLEQLKWLTTVSLANNQISDIKPLAGLRAPSLILLDGNKVKDLGPLYAAAKADLAGAKNWAPFLRLYLKGNKLSSASKKQVAELEKDGMRVVLK